MAPMSAMKTTTVHRIGTPSRKLRWSSPAVWLGLGLLAARGQAKLISIAPPYSSATMLTRMPHRPSLNGAVLRGQPRARARMITMFPAPEYCQKGIAAIAATAMQLHTGVCRVGDTRDRNLDPGSWLSRDMPKQSRIVAARIDRQQTKIAAETTSRYKVANGVEKLASMIC